MSLRNIILAFTLFVSTAVAEPPADYYDTVTSQSGELLHQELYLIVSGERGYEPVDLSYDNARIALSDDVDSLGGRMVRLFYTNEARPADEWPGDQSREHVWPQSYGADERPAFSDMHHLFLCDQGINSTRGNRLYANIQGGTPVPNPTGDPNDQNYYDSNDLWEVSPRHRGDAARAIFFMETRYPDFDLIDRGEEPGMNRMGYLSDLLLWHQQDPVDDFERSRNDKVFGYQNNRNPYIDHPEWVELVYTPANVANDDMVTVQVVNRAPRAVFPGEAPLMFTLAFEADSNEWDAGFVEIGKGGSIADTLVEAVVYTDLNGNGVLDEIDPEIGRGGFVSGAASITFDPVVRSAPGFPRTLFFVAEVPGAAPTGATIQLVLEENGFGYSATGGEDFNPPIGPAPSSLTTVLAPAFHAVFFSEYVEGDSNNKALEIFNRSAAVVDLAGWHVDTYFNGGTTPIPASGIALEGSLPPLRTFVLADSRATSPVLNAADQVSSSPFFNGDDAIVLVDPDGNIADSIGRIGEQAVWGTPPVATRDHTLRRKSTVTTGDKNPSDVYTPAAEWEGFPLNTFDDLGRYGGDVEMWITY